ncbi:MAG: GNAT family N-acetyltransferase, partial [Actinomycetales bacterium]|nr:GNAT family N-acetyltransferase [Actinomycetales bacterium]
VERLEVGDPEVDDLLAVAHPAADTDTADPRLFGWWGLRDGSALVAVVGALRFAPGLPPYLVSVATHPEHRGRGLAGRVMAAAVRDGLAESPQVGTGVSLALYASNDRARRVYLRHGFELRHQFESLRNTR